MSTNVVSKWLSWFAFLFLALLLLVDRPLAQDLSQTISDAAGLPQVAAFLPDRYSVEKSEAMVIDGVYAISANKKKIKIEQGRAFAIDSWLHLFILKVQPDMVVMQNFQRLGVGHFSADDLPLLGPAQMRLQPNGNLNVNVQGKLGPVAYTLILREATYPDYLNAEILALSNPGAVAPAAAPVTPPPVTPPPPAYGVPGAPAPVQPVPAPVQPIGVPAPAPAPGTGAPPPSGDCIPIGIDPDTGATICA